MAEETKIGMKLEDEAKPIKKMCEKLMDAVNYELDKGIENIDTKELGEAIDMIKDLYEAKKEMYEACYYKGVLEAMEEHDFEDEEEIMDDGRRGYRGQPRSESGRFMSRGDGRRSNRGRGGRRGYEEPMYRMSVEDYKMHEPEYWRDLDRVAGRMYFTDGNMSMDGNTSTNNMGNGSTRGYSENNGGQYSSRMQREGMNESRYDRAKRAYTETKEMNKDKGEKMKNLEEYMKELSSDVTSMISDMTPEEKTLMKQKMSVLMQKI